MDKNLVKIIKQNHKMLLDLADAMAQSTDIDSVSSNTLLDDYDKFLK